MQKNGQNVTEDPDSAIPRDTTKFLRLKLDNLGKEKSCNMWGWLAFRQITDESAEVDLYEDPYRARFITRWFSRF